MSANCSQVSGRNGYSLSSSIFKSAALGVMLFGLAACGGGSSTAPTKTTIVTPPPAPTDNGGSNTTPAKSEFETAEFEANWALPEIKAWKAYEEGATGEGITVAVIDTTFRQHADINWAEGSVFDQDPSGYTETEEDDGFHGTFVAGLIGAAKDDDKMHGVAYDADILAINIFGGDAVQSDYVAERDWGSDLARSFGHAMENGAQVVNISLSGEAQSEKLNTILAHYVYQDKDNAPILVISAGNDGYDNPSALAQGVADTAPDHVIIAGGINKDGENPFNKAGDYMNQFIVAPGVSVYSTDEVDGYAYGSGTSFSAPIVSGAVALALDMWPEMTSEEVVDLVFSTADDLGTEGVDAIFGHGLLNIEEMFTPQGDVKVISNGVRVSMTNTISVIPAAFGTANIDVSTVGFDSYNRDFLYDMSAFASTRKAQSVLHGLFDAHESATAGTRNLAASLTRNIADPAYTLSFREQQMRGAGQDVTASFYFSPQENVGLNVHLGHAGKDLPAARLSGLASSAAGIPGLDTADLALGMEIDDWRLEFNSHSQSGQGTESDLALMMAPERNRDTDRSRATVIAAGKDLKGFKLRVGALLEEGAVFGVTPQGMMAVGGGTRMAFMALRGEKPVSDNWTLFAEAEIFHGEVMGTAGSAFSDGFNATLTRFQTSLQGYDVLRKGDALTVTVAQPLKAERAMTSVLETYRTAGLYGFETNMNRSNLTPEMREINIGASYSSRVGENLSFDLHGLQRFNAQHQRGNATEIALRVNLKF